MAEVFDAHLWGNRLEHGEESGSLAQREINVEVIGIEGCHFVTRRRTRGRRKKKIRFLVVRCALGVCADMVIVQVIIYTINK